MKIDDSVIKNVMAIWSAPDVDKFDRARFIYDYITEKKMSRLEFCEKFKLAKGTLEGWIVWRKITPLQNQELINAGCSNTHIHNTLKSTTLKGSEAVSHILKTNDKFEEIVEKCITLLKPFSKNPPQRGNGASLRLVELRDITIQIIKELDRR